MSEKTVMTLKDVQAEIKRELEWIKTRDLSFDDSSVTYGFTACFSWIQEFVEKTKIMVDGDIQKQIKKELLLIKTTKLPFDDASVIYGFIACFSWIQEFVKKQK